MNQPITFRAAKLDDCDALGTITVAASLRAFIGRVPEDLLDLTWTPAQSANGWRQSLAELHPNDLFDVADMHEHGAVGFVWAGPSARQVGGVGEIRGLYVLPSQQRRGIGRQLVAHAVVQLRARSMSSLLVGCIKENPSCDFYRHLGGVEAFREPGAVDRYTTEEIFFFWRDSRVLA